MKPGQWRPAHRARVVLVAVVVMAMAQAAVAGVVTAVVAAQVEVAVVVADATVAAAMAVFAARMEPVHVGAADVTVVVVVVVAAATTIDCSLLPTKKAPSGVFSLVVVQPLAQKKPAPWSLYCSPWRRLRGRPDITLSNNALGKPLSSLATRPICQGITR